MAAETMPIGPMGIVCSGNSGPPPRNSGRAKPATAQAMATGRRLRGRSSNSSSSMASSMAATGVPNTAVMPATAPATSNAFLSALDRWKNCAMSEPIAPPVMMIGPSAPNGPPLPIAMAKASGLSTATFGDILLLPNKIASMASGMPWPRTCSAPKRAISPTSSPPTTGAATTNQPSVFCAGEWFAVDKVWKKNRFVKKRMRCSRKSAATVLSAPPTAAMAPMRRSRTSVAKSRLCALCSLMIPLGGCGTVGGTHGDIYVTA